LAGAAESGIFRLPACQIVLTQCCSAYCSSL
jgi:hypothetical protein